VIETERLLLRMPRLEDAEALETPIASLQRWLAEWEANEIGYFTVELASREVIGRVGFHVFDDRTWTLATLAAAREHAVTELGWTLLPEHRGRGYATEAAHAAREWAARDRLISLIEPANTASARVAERLGCRPGGTVELQDIGPAVVWEHPR
jgi:RimJ/RimL family protein N-acetyltransferase